MGLFISPRVRQKLLTKHKVTEAQVLQCFANRTAQDLFDNRPEHRTDPPTRWFIAETDYGIKLKVCYVLDLTTNIVEIKRRIPTEPRRARNLQEKVRLKTDNSARPLEQHDEHQS